MTDSAALASGAPDLRDVPLDEIGGQDDALAAALSRVMPEQKGAVRVMVAAFNSSI